MKYGFLFLILILVTDVCAQVISSASKVRTLPTSIYPAEALKTGLEGVVTVLVDVDKNGKVTKAYAATGPGNVCLNNDRADVIAMRQIARKAAEQSTFAPTGESTAETLLMFEFKNPAPKKNPENKPSHGYRISGVGTMDSSALSEKPEPSTATTDTKVVSGGVLALSPMSLPKPKYPVAARLIKAEGTVQVQIVIDTNGTVFSAQAISGHPLLRASAVDAVCQARFVRTFLSGEPVSVSGIVAYNFTL
ncbi:MAG: TonB family protein [Chloracidobacterium sp.]|nr:TonB family protein [Chloracidobacterium sp.]